MMKDKETTSAGSAIKQYLINLKQLPGTLRHSIIRHGVAETSRARAQTVFSNIFLHIHSVKVHRFSLRWNYTFGLGIMSASLFFILTVTGLLLMVYYEPSTLHAFNSMKDIIYIVPSGRLVRNVHRWAAHLMVVCVFLHMARVFYTGSYKSGREFNWLVGLLLLVLTLALSFTGYLLPWDQLAYWAVTIGTNIASSPQEVTDALGITERFDVGALQRHLLIGADQIGNNALVRFYFLHCIFLPLLLTIFVAVHVWRVRKDGGLSRPATIDPEWLKGLPENRMAEQTFASPSHKTYSLMAVVKGKRPESNGAPEETVDAMPHAFVREFTAFMFILAVTLALAYFFAAPLKEPANPAVPENPAKAPWYFLGLQELVSYSAFMGGIGIPTIALLGLGLIPYLDRERGRIGHWFENEQGRFVAIWSVMFSALSCVAVLAFTVNFGWLRNWFPAIPQIIITFCNPGTLLVAMFAIWSIATIKRFDSIRIGAIALFTCFLVAFMILTYFATVHRGPNWQFYWWPSLWPGY
ncbi:MAG: cytochrome b N-terminal domain-containing protein [bacterium]